MSCQDSNVYLTTSYLVMSVILHVYFGKKVPTCNIFTYFSEMVINNSTCDDRNTKHTITRYLTNGWVTVLSFHTDTSKIQ